MSRTSVFYCASVRDLPKLFHFEVVVFSATLTLQVESNIFVNSSIRSIYFADEKIEAELIGFEKLLNEVMVFKSNSSIWSRNDRLSYTQNFAEAFDDLIGEGSSDEEQTQWSKTKPD